LDGAARPANCGYRCASNDTKHMLRFGWATDPEGNRFELWEPRSPGYG